MDLPSLHGIVPPVPTPLNADESLDEAALRRMVRFLLEAGVHGLWVLGTTSRFDLLTDADQRRVAEIVAETVGGRVPMVLNVSDMGTRRTLLRARLFDDLPYDYYAALPPWYQPMRTAELRDFFHALADELERPVFLYNAPWVCNPLSLNDLRDLAGHPRIAGVKDVFEGGQRVQDWPASERRAVGFSYLQGTDDLTLPAGLGADGFVSSLTNAVPELAVAIWDAARRDDAERAFRLQLQFSRLSWVSNFGPMLACIEAMCRHRRLLSRMLPRPLQPLDDATTRRVIAAIETIGILPEPATAMVV